jgi:hypothetical protein
MILRKRKYSAIPDGTVFGILERSQWLAHIHIRALMGLSPSPIYDIYILNSIYFLPGNFPPDFQFVVEKRQKSKAFFAKIMDRSGAPKDQGGG